MCTGRYAQAWFRSVLEFLLEDLLHLFIFQSGRKSAETSARSVSSSRHGPFRCHVRSVERRGEADYLTLWEIRQKPTVFRPTTEWYWSFYPAISYKFDSDNNSLVGIKNPVYVVFWGWLIFYNCCRNLKTLVTVHWQCLTFLMTLDCLLYFRNRVFWNL